MKRRNICLAIAVASIVALCSLSNASGKTWYVRQDGTGDTSSLADAIASAQDGDSILVGPGTYSTYQGFDVSKALHIVSEQGPEVTTITNHSCIGVGGPCPGSWGFYVHDFSGPFTIRGFTVKKVGDCLEIFCPEWDGDGVAIRNASGRIADNAFYDNHKVGASVAGASTVVFEGNLMRGDLNIGLLVRGGATVDVRSNTFSGGSTFYPEYYWAHIFIYDDGTSADIHHNILVNSPAWGIATYSSGAIVTMQCNDFWNNAAGNCGGILHDPVGMNGNIGADPLFCGIGVFTIRADSPCAEAQVPSVCSGLRMGCYPVDCPVAVRESSWGSIKSIFGDTK